jgi:PBSX family phage terminase large subunit
MVSVLSTALGGNILEPPTPKRNQDFKETSQELKDRILASSLPAQKEFLLDHDHRIIGLVAGFGAGKTHALCHKAIFLALANIGTVGLVAEPTYPMVRDVFCRSFDEALERWDIQHEFRVSPQPEYVLHFPEGDVTILCRSLETWQRIRGQNLSFCLADEIDTSPTEVSQKASEMMLARMRSGVVNQLAIATTPEGFKWAYRTFVENDGEDKRLIKARTQDNPYLPADFVPSLERNYPGPLIKAYLEGEFVNLASCALYPDFSRIDHYTDAKPEQRETIYCGIDINVGFCATVHLVRRGDAFHIFDEAVYRDTAQIAEGLKEKYRYWFDNQQLVLIPDASAKQRSTAAASESDLGILKKAGHKVSAQQSNPLVQDRINAVNALIRGGRLLVSNDCRNVIRTLEQHAFDEKGRPEKGGIGADDLSHHGDAMGYVVYRLASIRQWTTDQRRSRRVW